MTKRKACKLHFYSLHAFLFYYYCLQSRSESCAWQWGGEVIVLIIILIQEIHPVSYTHLTLPTTTSV